MFIGIVFSACQFSPINKGDDLVKIADQAIINLQRQAPVEISKPLPVEEQLIKNTIIELLHEKDARFYPYVAHLKDSRYSLLLNDANKELAREKALKDSKYSAKLRFYKLAIAAYLMPKSTYDEINSIQFPQSIIPNNWEKLKSLITERIELAENQLVILQLQLLKAESARNTKEQVLLNKKILGIESLRNNRPKIIYHLQRLIELSPNNLEKLNYYQTLISIYKEDQRFDLAEKYSKRALVLAKDLGATNVVQSFEADLGIINDDPKVVDFAEDEYTDISVIEKAISEKPNDYLNADNLLYVAEKYRNLGDIPNSIKTATKSLDNARSTANINAEGLSIVLIGDLARINGDLKRANLQYALAFEIFKSQNNFLEQLLTISKIITTAIYSENDKLVERSFTLAQNILDSELPTTINKDLWTARIQAQKFIYQAWKQKSFNDQDKLWTDALGVIENQPGKLLKEETLGESALILNKLKQFSLSLRYYENAVSIANSQNRYFEAARYYTNMALIYNSMNNIENSRSNLRQAAIIFQSMRSPHLQEIKSMIANLGNK